MTQTTLIEPSDGIHPLSWQEASAATLPFLLFGLCSLADRLELFWAIPSTLPFRQILFVNPFLVFNWLVLLGLGAGLLLGFPRWAVTYLGWAILFAWWWRGATTYGYPLDGILWLALLGMCLAILLLRRSIQPLRALLAHLWHDWTLPSLGIYILYASMFMLYDENHHPYLILFIIAATLACSLGAWGYFRAEAPLRRILALMGGLALAIIISVLNWNTWDYVAYYDLPESMRRVNLAAVVAAVGLAGLMLGNGLLAQRRGRRQFPRRA